MRKLFTTVATLAVCLVGLAQNNYTLEQLRDSAKVNNSALKSARYDAQAATEQRKEAFTKFFPNISAAGVWFATNNGMAKVEIDPSKYLSPGIAQILAQILPAEAIAALGNPISIEMMKNGLLGSVMAVQPVFAGGQIVNGNKLAKVGEEAGQLQLQLAENEAVHGVEEYFWKLVSLKEKVKTINAVEQLLNDINKNVSAAVDAGVVLRNDLLQVQLRQNDIESQKLKLNNGIRLVKMLLAQLCGLQEDDFTITYALREDLPMVPREDHAAALPQTTEYKLLGKQLEATQLQKKMEVGKYLPTLAVGAGYSYHNLLDRDYNFGMIFATVRIPISDWWGGSHAIKRKKLAVLKAQEDLDSKSRLLSIRMQNAWNGVEESWEEYAIALKSIEQAQENLRIYKNCYDAGTSTMTDLLQAQLLYQQAMDKKTEAYSAYMMKVLEYNQAIGK